jgi:Holliday junction resolvase-like predicted endonuclease
VRASALAATAVNSAGSTKVAARINRFKGECDLVQARARDIVQIIK